MDKLLQYSFGRVNSVSATYKRYLYTRINWKNRLIALTGARGTGKTTMLLQYIRENLNQNSFEVIFVSMDDLYFSRNSLVEFADAFVKRGGKFLFIDEIHKYPEWSREIKNIYDYYSDLQIIITGSSALDIFSGTADLSRRAILYQLKGLSFREFIQLKYNISFPVIPLDDILYNPSFRINEIVSQIKPIRLFEEYLETGYYPFFKEGEESYHERLQQVVNHVLDVDLPATAKIDYQAVHHLRTLLSIISEIVPFKPNILKLSHQTGISRETMMKYLHLLEKADLLMLLKTGKQGISRLNKPEKVYLENTNLMYALTASDANRGSIRETFLCNQLSEGNSVEYPESGDFKVNDKFTIEVGGKNKTRKQIAGVPDSFIAADNIEYAYQNTIPLWLFGFLY